MKLIDVLYLKINTLEIISVFCMSLLEGLADLSQLYHLVSCSVSVMDDVAYSGAFVHTG